MIMPPFIIGRKYSLTPFPGYAALVYISALCQKKPSPSREYDILM
jgi:hypothetical protein